MNHSVIITYQLQDSSPPRPRHCGIIKDFLEEAYGQVSPQWLLATMVADGVPVEASPETFD